MMLTGDALTERLTQEFTSSQAVLLSEVITAAYADLVKAGDLNELKEIVRDLAEAQQRTEQRVAQLAEAQQGLQQTVEHLAQQVSFLAEAQQRTEQRVAQLAEAQQGLQQTVEHLAQQVSSLAEAQQRTEQRVAQLAEAQQRTEQRVAQLAKAQQRTEQTVERLTQRVDALAEAQQRTEQTVQRLVNALDRTRSELAGLGRQFGYALENEAFRALPALLRERFDIELTQRFVRTYIDGHEVNLLAEGIQNGTSVLLVGEVKAHLGTDDFEQLEKSLLAVRRAQDAGELPRYRIVPLFVAHVARPAALRYAEAQGIIVVQSFEW